MTKNGTNILSSLLIALNVKHTKAFANRHFNEHPHKYNLFGISEMLNDFGVPNGGVRIIEKISQIKEIQTPFIAQVSGGFVTVYNVTDNVEYRTGTLDLELPIPSFCDKWSGIALLVEKTDDSIEPNYDINRKKELIKNSLEYTLLIAIPILFIMGVIYNGTYSDIGIILSFMVNTIGIYTSLLLVQKSLKIHSKYSDKICSLLKKADCNNVLDTKAAKLWGVFGWSEIGLSYFTSNLIVIAFLPELSTYYVVINMFTLPFTLWSVWYQRYKAKQWCMLCLIVQILLWSIFTINITVLPIETTDFVTSNTITVATLYLVSFISISLITPYLAEHTKLENIKQEINSIKAHEGVASLLLEEQPYYPTDESTSQIIFGNKNSKILISILTNPHCEPCAKMHSRVEKLLDAGANVRVQYIFSSFDSSLDISSKFLISAYLNKADATREIYNEWFNEGKDDRERFFNKYPIDLTDEDIKIELENHRKWKSDNKFGATPTILINGYKLPENYQIEDYRYISELRLTNEINLQHIEHN